jgi:hypothetical protein
MSCEYGNNMQTTLVIHSLYDTTKSFMSTYALWYHVSPTPTTYASLTATKTITYENLPTIQSLLAIFTVPKVPQICRGPWICRSNSTIRRSRWISHLTHGSPAARHILHPRNPNDLRGLHIHHGPSRIAVHRIVWDPLTLRNVPLAVPLQLGFWIHSKSGMRCKNDVWDPNMWECSLNLSVPGQARRA